MDTDTITKEQKHSPAVAKAMARFWSRMAEVQVVTDAIKQERGELSYLFQMRAIDHEHAAEESARNDETDDEDAHMLEAHIWRMAAEMVSARNNPPAPAEPADDQAEIPDDEIAF